MVLARLPQLGYAADQQVLQEIDALGPRDVEELAGPTEQQGHGPRHMRRGHGRAIPGFPTVPSARYRRVDVHTGGNGLARAGGVIAVGEPPHEGDEEVFPALSDRRRARSPGRGLRRRAWPRRPGPAPRASRPRAGPRAPPRPRGPPPPCPRGRSRGGSRTLPRAAASRPRGSPRGGGPCPRSDPATRAG